MENEGIVSENESENEINDFEQLRINDMEIIIAEDYEQMSQLGADQMYELIKDKPDSLICIATGSTPTRAYDLLAAKLKDEPAATGKLRIIKLDEWGGIPSDDPATCETYIKKHLVDPLQVTSDRFVSFESDPKNPEQEIQRIADVLEKEGRIDLCILGMGINGHLGFNEPAEFLNPDAHIATLTDTTKKHTMAQEAEHEIKYGLTLGMKDIMHSKMIILMVNGTAKQEPFKKFLSGEIKSQFPASLLCLHPNMIVLCDREVVPDSSSIVID